MIAKNASKIVFDDVKRDELSPRLVGTIDPSHRLRVTVEDLDAMATNPSRMRGFAGAAKSRNTSVKEAVARIRELRDEALESH